MVGACYGMLSYVPKCFVMVGAPFHYQRQSVMLNMSLCCHNYVTLAMENEYA
jgi:hypothetical protein